MANQNDAAESTAPASVASTKSRKRSPEQAERERIADRKRYEERKSDPSIAERRNAIRKARRDRNPEKARETGRKWTQSRKDDPDFREARRKAAREWRKRHPDKVAENAAKARATPFTPEQMERRREADRQRYAKVKDDPDFKAANVAKMKVWCKANPGVKSEKASAQRAANPQIERERDRKRYIAYLKDRRRTDPNLKILAILRGRLYLAVKAAGAQKADHTLNLLGCTVRELRVHIESKFRDGMSWETTGNYGTSTTESHAAPSNSWTRQSRPDASIGRTSSRFWQLKTFAKTAST